MKNKLITREEIGEHLFDGMVILFGGFLSVGTPATLVQAILDSGVKDLTIVGNDTSFPEKGIAPIIAAGQVKKVVTSHIGTNPLVGQKMMAGELEVELVPQGTLAERIRSGGAGLGGVLTPTGLGTIVAEGKETIEVDGKTYLLEKPIKGDLSILFAETADEKGNLVYSYAARNFNPVMATASTLVIAEVNEIVPVGSIHPEQVMTPGILVDRLLLAQ